MTDHELSDFVNQLAATVGDLQTAVAEAVPAFPTLACVQCAAEQYQAAANGTPEADLPPIRVADVIANGASVCFGHIQFGPAPIAPGRTASGLVLPGQGG